MRKATRRMIAVTLLLGALGAAYAQAASGKEVAPPVTEAERDAKRKDTIRYGIDAEIMDLLTTLSGEKEGRYNDDLLALFSASRSSKLRIAILEFFRNLEWPSAEDEAVRIVEERDLEDAGLVSASLSYLAALRSKKALRFAPKLIEENDRKLLPAVVKLLGRAGGPAEEELLLSWLSKDAPTEALRLEAILALGEIGSRKSVEALMKIVEGAEEPKMNRIYAAGSLGKIGDVRAVTALVKAANADDPNVRTAAIEALGAFESREAERALLEAFRDSFVKARIAACQATAKRRLSSALPVLEYKAAKDPDKAVRREAFRALADIGSELALAEPFAFMRSFYDEPKSETEFRALVFGLLVRKDRASLAWLVERFTAASAEKERSLFKALAREVASATEAAGIEPLVRILLRDKEFEIRLGGLEWARKSKSTDIRGDLSALAESDPSETVRKRAAEILASF